MSKADKRERQRENRERARIERERLQKRDKQMKTFRSLLYVLVPVIAILVVITLVNGNDDDTSTKASTAPKYATIDTSAGTIVTKLDTAKAPIASQRFISLAEKGYYDGLCFDRLSPDFVIQGGSPTCDQQGGEGNPVTGEVPKDHYPVGSLAGAKGGGDPAGTFDSQFFIVTGSQGATLPNDYARFGSVVSGLDVAQAIEKLPVQPGTEKPVDKITIKKVTISNKAPAGSTSTSSTTAAP